MVFLCDTLKSVDVKINCIYSIMETKDTELLSNQINGKKHTSQKEVIQSKNPNLSFITLFKRGTLQKT